MAKERDARIFCRCGLMWDNRHACPHCDQLCLRGVAHCARCALHSRETDADAHRGRRT